MGAVSDSPSGCKSLDSEEMVMLFNHQKRQNGFGSPQEPNQDWGKFQGS